MWVKREENAERRQLERKTLDKRRRKSDRIRITAHREKEITSSFDMTDVNPE